MSADISRSTFRPDLNYTAVLALQGRVQLDADLNEQSAIHNHRLRTLTADLIGPAGGPRGASGFGIEPLQPDDGSPPDLRIGPGRYYVDGVPVQATPAEPLTPAEGEAPSAAEPWTYWSQPHAYLDAEEDDDRLPAPPFLIYLQVSEQVVTGLQDPQILEKALAGVDTTARLRAGWQVLPIREDDGFEAPDQPSRENLDEAFTAWAAERSVSRAALAVRTRQPAATDREPCLAAPDARYRGLENQLYRFEVHAPGEAGTATFKWSRENGSVEFGISSVQGPWLTLAAAGRDEKLDLQVDDWVEIGDDASLARPDGRPLWQVVEVDAAGRAVRLVEGSDSDDDEVSASGSGFGSGSGSHGDDDDDDDDVIVIDPDRHPFLRRWDHRGSGKRGAPELDDGALVIEEGRWLDVEDGIEIWFAPGGSYRGGASWNAAARTLDGDVEWPRDEDGTALLRPPSYPQVHLAPLAWVDAAGQVIDLRRTFAPLAGFE